MLAEKSGQKETRVVPGDLDVYELLCVPVLAVDTGFNVIFINEKACEITGYSREDVREKKLSDIASAGKMKKKLLRLFHGQVFERDFTIRNPLITKNGRVRDVEWQCRTMYQGILRAGAVITFVDRTCAETVIAIARIIAGSTSAESMVYRFMDLLSDPLNLKLARISLHAQDGQTHNFVRAYPHGGVRKKPRQALRDSSHASGPAEMCVFRLKVGGRSIGKLELVPYGESPLSAEDGSYVSRLCDILSSGIARLPPSRSFGAGSSAAPGEPPAARRKSDGSEVHAEAIESPDMAKNLMDLLPCGVITCDRDGMIMTVNESAVKVLGIHRNELVGLAAVEIARRLAPGRKYGTVPGTRNMAIYRALRTGNPALNMRSTVLVNGSRRALSTCAMPVRDAAGDVTGCLAIVRDITVITSIVKIGRRALDNGNADDLIEESLEIIMNAMRLRLVSLYLKDGDELKLIIQKGVYDGMPVPECRDLPDPLSPTLQSRAFLSGKPVLIKDYRRCASVRLFDPLARKRPVSSMAAIPLRVHSGVFGVLVAATGEGRPMDEAQLAGLSAMCGQLAAGIDRTVAARTQR